jgi:hypothetical protein
MQVNNVGMLQFSTDLCLSFDLVKFPGSQFFRVDDFRRKLVSSFFLIRDQENFVLLLSGIFHGLGVECWNF